MKLHSATLLLIFPVLATTSAYAVDGVLEINHTCATQLGCFSGDAVNYPITIDGTAGGSYRLTSNLIVPNENTDGITVSSPSISIDLNGFAIVRSGCEGAITDCTPASGTGSGVTVSGAFNGVSVRNGSVVGMGAFGVDLYSAQGEAVGLRVRWNRSGGIWASTASTIRDNIVFGNGSNGIFTHNGSTVSGNTTYDNGADGIYTATGSTVSGNTAHGNGDDGIYAGEGSTVSGNTTYFNSGDGIEAGSGSTVQRNTVRVNVGFGLNLSSDSAYRENVITGNGGTVNSGYNMGSNFCNTNSTCP